MPGSQQTPEQLANAVNPTASNLKMPGGSFFDSNDPYQQNIYVKNPDNTYQSYNVIDTAKNLAGGDAAFTQAAKDAGYYNNVTGIMNTKAASDYARLVLKNNGIDTSTIQGQNFNDLPSAKIAAGSDLKAALAGPSTAASTQTINNTGPNPLATPAQLAAAKTATDQQLAPLQGKNLVTQTDANGKIISSQAVPLANGTQPTPPGGTTPTGQPSQNTSTTSSATGGGAALPDQADRNQLAQVVADYQAKSQQVQDTIANIQSGATPLTSGEQAQITGLQQQMQTLIDTQTRANATAQNSALLRGYQTGSAEYDNLFAVTTIGKIASAGQQEVSKLQVQEAAAVAQLTQSFHDNDIQAVKDAWNVYQDSYKETRDQIQKTIDDTTAAINKATDDYYKQVTAPIEDIQSTAAKNGAPASVLAAISSSGSVSGALAAGGNWLQTATGDLGDYLNYSRQAQATGQVPSSYSDWLKASKASDAAQKASEAYSTAYGAAKGKAAGEAAGGVSTLKPLTESQSRDLTYATRGTQANDIIGNLQGSILNMSANAYTLQTLGGTQDFLNPYLSADMRAYLQARYNFTAATLRRESGASISPSEYATADIIYIPRPGDDAVTLANKAQARQSFIDTTKSNVPDYDARSAQTPTGLLNTAETLATQSVTQYAATNPAAAASVRSMVAAGKSYADIKTLLGI